MIIYEDRNYFKGYIVPESIKRATLAIMKRFSIFGECDGMYIANTIGHIDGTGDGKGHFSFYGNKPILKCIEIAERLQHCYDSNIEKTEIEELARILLHGEIEPREAIPGIKKFIQKREEEKKICDAWRIDYLKKIIAEAQQTLSELETGSKKNIKINPICEKCLRLGNECAGTYCHVWTGCVCRKV